MNALFTFKFDKRGLIIIFKKNERTITMKSAQRNSYIWKTTCFSLAECVLAHPLCITKVTLWHSLKAIQLKKIIWSLSNGVPTFTIVPHLRHSFAQTLYSVLCYLPHQRILFCSECPLSISYLKKTKLSLVQCTYLQSIRINR